VVIVRATLALLVDEDPALDDFVDQSSAMNQSSPSRSGQGVHPSAEYPPFVGTIVGKGSLVMKTQKLPSKRHVVRLRPTSGARTRSTPTTARAASAPADSAGDLPAIDLAAIQAAVAVIRAELPPLRVLTADDRRRLFKMNDKRAALAQRSQSAAGNALVQVVVPPSFKLPRFAAQAARTATLIKVHTVIEQLFSDVDDTLMAERSDVITGAAKLYAYVKAGVEDNPGLKPIADQLGEAFKKTNSKPAPATAEAK